MVNLSQNILTTDEQCSIRCVPPERQRRSLFQAKLLPSDASRRVPPELRRLLQSGVPLLVRFSAVNSARSIDVN